MTAAEAMAVADAAVAGALDHDVRSPDEMRAAIRALDAAFTAVGEAHDTIVEEARALGATERADTAEVDAMLTSLTELWGARFGGGPTDTALEAPGLFATSWREPDPAPIDPGIHALDTRAHALLDAWTQRTGAWRALAALERRSLVALASLHERQRAFSAQFAAAKVAAVAIPTLETERDELSAVLRALAADPASVPRAAIASAGRRSGAALVVASKLHGSHGTIPGLGEHLAELVDTLRILRDAFAAAKPHRR